MELLLQDQTLVRSEHYWFSGVCICFSDSFALLYIYISPSLSFGFNTVLVGKFQPVWEDMRERFVWKDRRIVHFKGRPWGCRWAKERDLGRDRVRKELGSAQEWSPPPSSSLSPSNPFFLLRQGPPPLILFKYFLGWGRIWLEVSIERIMSTFQGPSKPGVLMLQAKQASGRKSLGRQACTLRKMDSVYNLCLGTL